jgi:hypothetical protein
LAAARLTPQDRVGAKPHLVLGAVAFDHQLVDLELVLRLHADHRLRDLGVDAFHRLVDALAEPARLVAVALFDRLVSAGGGAGRDCGTAHAAILQQHLDLHSRLTAAVEDLAGVDVEDSGHCFVSGTNYMSG